MHPKSYQCCYSDKLEDTQKREPNSSNTQHFRAQLTHTLCVCVIRENSRLCYHGNYSVVRTNDWFGVYDISLWMASRSDFLTKYYEIFYRLNASTAWCMVYAWIWWGSMQSSAQFSHEIAPAFVTDKSQIFKLDHITHNSNRLTFTLSRCVKFEFIPLLTIKRNNSRHMLLPVAIFFDDIRYIANVKCIIVHIADLLFFTNHFDGIDGLINDVKICWLN